jgi:hypothetical protein
MQDDLLHATSRLSIDPAFHRSPTYVPTSVTWFHDDGQRLVMPYSRWQPHGCTFRTPMIAVPPIVPIIIALPMPSVHVQENGRGD